MTHTQTPETWLARGFRLSLFPSAPMYGKPSWWEEIVGRPPDSESSQRSQGLVQQAGVFEGGQLALITRPSRIDWTFGAVEGEPSSGDIPSLGAFSSVLELFTSLAHRWLSSCSSATRLAFGADLVQPSDSIAAAYLRLGYYLQSIKIDPENSSDFFYRINRPRLSRSGINGLKINRLSSWSVLQARLLSFEVAAVGRPKSSHVSLAPSAQPACRVELDINSSADFVGDLPSDTLNVLFSELIELANEIATQGDVP